MLITKFQYLLNLLYIPGKGDEHWDGSMRGEAVTLVSGQLLLLFDQGAAAEDGSQAGEKSRISSHLFFTTKVTKYTKIEKNECS